jgi:arabinose-5-phosphate isomerase
VNRDPEQLDQFTFSAFPVVVQLGDTYHVRSIQRVNEAGELVGMVTDGDLRRNLADDLLSRSVSDVMTIAPKTLPVDTLVASAIEQMNAASITALFVVENKRPVGLLHMHDLLRIGAA